MRCGEWASEMVGDTIERLVPVGQAATDVEQERVFRQFPPAVLITETAGGAVAGVRTLSALDLCATALPCNLQPQDG